MLDVLEGAKILSLPNGGIQQMDRLFLNISLLNLGMKMSKAAIASSIRMCIREAYKAMDLVQPEGIIAHSTRSAATMATLMNWASIEDICKAAT